MIQQPRKRLGFAIALAACLVGSAPFIPAAAARRSPAKQGGQRSVPAGATTTRLADGRRLIVGGEGTSGPLASAAIFDPNSGTTTPLAIGLQQARTGHTATLLPDGTVLIAGGQTGPGQMVTLAELFDPATEAFLPLAVSGAAARSGQSATLLTDGRVLVAGGAGADGTLLNTAEIWDMSHDIATQLPGVLVHARAGQQADLLGDGRVLLSSGTGTDGTVVRDAEVFDPTVLSFAAATDIGSTRGIPDAPPQVAASVPDSTATDVPVDVRIALRFSQPLAAESVTERTVNLAGPNGPVEIAIVPAENGRLVFATPRVPLETETKYQLVLDGAMDQRGVAMAPASIVFTTVATPGSSSAPGDPEAWTPGGNGANGWQSGRPDSPWRSLAPLRAAPGTTALAGQVLRLDGKPLADVKLGMEGRTASTDRSGRFLLILSGLASGDHTLAIDGRLASHGPRRYGFYEARIPLKAGITNVLPFTIWSPLLDVAHEVTIPSPTTSEVVVTTPTMPGLELHLPQGTVIRGEDGSVVRKLTITPIPLDRTPFPLPTDAAFNMFFTIQPGGAYIDTPGPVKGAWLVYPNRTTLRVGARTRFYTYDPDDKGWFPYGLGTVTPRSVTPDPTTRFYAFTGSSFDSLLPLPLGGSTPAGGPRGDPVDPSTGAFVMTKTDLYLPDVMPITLTRTYNAQDTQNRAFGTSMTHSYGFLQYTDNMLNDGNLVLPEGGRIYYVRITPAGLPWYQTVYECQTKPTPFYKSQLAFDGNAWAYTLKDGTVYTMGHQAPLQSIRDRFGNVTRLTWSQTNIWGAGYGNLVRITSPNGRWIEFTYDTASPVNHVTQAKDNIGRTVNYTYDANGNLSTVTDPENNVTTYTWDASNRMVSIKDGRNITYLTNQYDASNRVTRQTLADPNATYGFAYTMDGNGNITQTAVTDPQGHVEQLNFNPDHYLTSDVQAFGQPETRTLTIERQAGSDLLTAVVDGLNRRAEFTYDTSGHMLTVTRLAGTQDAVTTTYTYEPRFFQLSTITDPLNHTWTLGYDTTGSLASASDPLAHQTTVALNTLGQVTSVTDPLQHAWHFGYTGGDRTSMTSPVGSAWQTTLDAAGRVLSQTDSLGHTMRRMSDKLDRVTSTTDPLGGHTSFTYDPNDRLLSLTDDSSHATSYTYDASNRVATRTDPLLNITRYEYDLNDSLTQTTDRKGQVTSYQYDALNRLTLVTYADNSTTQYTYDAGDRVILISQTTAGVTTTIAEAYDDFDRVTSETTPEGSVSYTYDSDGRRRTMTVAGQPQVTYDYDNAHRLTSITQGTNVVLFTYDAADRLSTLTLPNGILATYGYDDANELTSLSYALGATTLGTLTYAYDLAGNRTAVAGTWARTGLPEPLTSATYDAANRVQSWAGQAFSYDASGNLTSDGLTSYAWNARDQLSGMSGATSAAFDYDGLGRRRSKTLGGSTTKFLYEGVNLVQELSGSIPTANLLTGRGIDFTLTRTDAAGASTLLTDALGSTLELADSSGALQTHYTYEPFGASTTSGATTGNAQQFTGREDDHNGLQFYRARYYRAELQRFTSEDPIEFAGGTTNLHQYVANDPVNGTDPLGMQKGAVAPGPASSPGGAAWMPESLLEWLWDELTSGPPPGPYPPPLDKYSKDAQAKCEKSRRGCKPCIPPIGTIAYRLDDSPNSVPHYSKPLNMDIPAPHWALFVMIQSPPDVVDPCRCHWKKLVDLPGGLGNGPTPSGTVPIAPPAGGGSLPIRAGGW